MEEVSASASDPVRAAAPPHPTWDVAPQGGSWATGRRAAFWFAACAALYLVAALAVATKVTGLLNHDAVSYLTLARHWLHGRFDLGVTGTWSPFLSWCLAAALSVTSNEDLAVRVVMALSGFVFLCGGCIFYARQPSARVAWIAGGLTAVFAAALTGVLITPDLLGAGLFLLGFATFLRTLDEPRAASALASGALLALAYLAKAIYLPLAIASCGAIAALHLWSGRRTRTWRSAAPTVALAALAGLLVAGPWIAALTAKYDRFTYTRATIPQWSSIGPHDMPRDQPTNIRFYVPEPGRQSQFEDESILPTTTWSPFDSRAYFLHYVWHVGHNVLEIQPAILRRMDVLNAGFLALLVFFAARVTRRARVSGALFADGPWPMLAVPTLLLLAAYALNFGDQLRYYLVAVPGVYLGALVAWPRVVEALGARRGRIVGLAIAVLSLLLPITLLRADLADWSREGADSREMLDVARTLESAGLRGPVATVGEPRLKHPAIYLSYRLGTTYNGTEDARSLDAVERACARLLVLDPANPVLPELLASGGYVRADSLAPKLAEALRDARFTLLWKVAAPDPARCRYSERG